MSDGDDTVPATASQVAAALNRRLMRPVKGSPLTLMHDMQGTAAQRPALFGKLKAAGGFANEDPAQLLP